MRIILPIVIACLLLTPASALAEPARGSITIERIAEIKYPTAPAWSPDGRRVAVAGLEDGRWNVWWATRDGSRQQRLTDYTDEHHYVRNPEWSPRGDRLVYEFAQVSGNVWVVQPGNGVRPPS
ncbi:MAG: TolB family protein [Vicinamibacteria bacterium]